MRIRPSYRRDCTLVSFLRACGASKGHEKAETIFLKLRSSSLQFWIAFFYLKIAAGLEELASKVFLKVQETCERYLKRRYKHVQICFVCLCILDCEVFCVLRFQCRNENRKFATLKLRKFSGNLSSTTIWFWQI